ncbi:MAG TPA: DUF4013 domain-containing protein [Candidatus Limnocylindrales bacterium]|nr:DUF4013 domain-containing protein [Candidatus Limnocylindrales bacterium]
MRLVAESFAWPFRAGPSTWIWGLVSVLFLPILFVPLLGYAIAATRSAELYPTVGPPPWRFPLHLLWTGGWTSLVLLLTLAPFVLAWNPLAEALSNRVGGELNAHVIALFVIALPWGLVALLLLPHATASFASTGNPQDLFDLGASLRGVRGDFATWNVVVAAIVTAWAIGIACAGLLCVGIVPGVFYAILVSAHAAAALRREGQSSSAR